MSRNKRAFRFLILYVGVSAFLSFAYTNCGKIGAGSDGTETASESGASCDEVRIKKYSSGYYPFVRANCISCHIEGGPGLGAFASEDLATSFAAFSAAGVSKVGYMATNPAHKPPYTGTQHNSTIDRLSKDWQASEKEFLECVSRSENGGVDDSLLTSAKGAPGVYSGCTTAGGVTTCPKQTLTWDLNLASDLDASAKRGVPARLSIDVSLLTVRVNNVDLAKGYVFSNPVMQMTESSQQLVVEGLFFYINGQPITSQTTFTSLSRVVSGTNPIPLYNAQANTLIEPVSTGDVFQLYVRRLVPTSGVEDAPPPLTPILNLADAETVSDSYAKSRDIDVYIMRDAGVVRWCLSESPVKPESTEAPCVNSETGAGYVNGWKLSRPTSFRLSSGDGQKRLYLWVASESLKINAVPAEDTILLDTVAPQPASIGAITVGQTQVAPMSVSHANESDVAGWCVWEQNYVKALPTRPSLDHDCWRWTDNGAKPSTVGFKEGGTRDVWVFVRDRAGNVSSPSNSQRATNPWGAVTFAELTSKTASPRSVFNNRCLACHSDPTYPGFNKLQLFNYASAVESAEDGLLVSRINNVISPMPNVNGGLMPQVERDLIRLWTMPEEGDTPIP